MIFDLLNRIPAFADLPDHTQDLIARLLLFVLALVMLWVLRRALTANSSNAPASSAMKKYWTRCCYPCGIS